MAKSAAKKGKDEHPISLRIPVVTRDRIAYALAKHNLDNPHRRLKMADFEIELLEAGLKHKEAQLKIRHAI